MRSFCQSWSCMGLKVQVWIFFETTSLTELRLQLLIMWSLKLVAYVVAQSSAPCFSCCTLTTFQIVTSYQMWGCTPTTLTSRLPPTTNEELFSSLTHDLSNSKQWLDSNRQSLNVLKTKCLFTDTRHKIYLLPSEPHICLDGHLIERVNSYKCLGVQVDETLSWVAHIYEVVSLVA